MIFSSLLTLFFMSATPSNEFVFNNGAEPEVLDPHRISSHNDAQLVIQMFEGLLGRDETYDKLVPVIAAELPEVSKDRLRYTFKIPKGLKWSNGDDLTIEQVRGSFFRAMRPEVMNPFINLYIDNIGIYTESDPTGILLIEEFSYNLMPNPANNIVTIQLEKEFHEVDISLRDIQGRLVYQMESSSINASIDVSSISNGIYFVEVVSSSGKAIRKLVVSH